MQEGNETIYNWRLYLWDSQRAITVILKLEWNLALICSGSRSALSAETQIWGEAKQSRLHESHIFFQPRINWKLGTDIIQQTQGNVLHKQIYKTHLIFSFKGLFQSISLSPNWFKVNFPQLSVYVGSLVFLIFVLHCTFPPKYASFFSHKAGIEEAQRNHRSFTTLCCQGHRFFIGLMCLLSTLQTPLVYLFAYLYNVQDFYLYLKEE